MSRMRPRTPTSSPARSWSFSPSCSAASSARSRISSSSGAPASSRPRLRSRQAPSARAQPKSATPNAARAQTAVRPYSVRGSGLSRAAVPPPIPPRSTAAPPVPASPRPPDASTDTPSRASTAHFRRRSRTSKLFRISNKKPAAVLRHGERRFSRQHGAQSAACAGTASGTASCVSTRAGLAVARIAPARAMSASVPRTITRNPSAFSALSYSITLSFGTPRP